MANNNENKRAELEAKATELGVEFTAEVSDKDLAKAIVKAEKAIAKGGSGDTTYIWCKYQIYVSPEERLNAGLYIIDLEKYPQVLKHKSDAVEIFNGEIPTKTLYKIAEHCGIDTRGYKGSDEELIEKIATVAVPFTNK